MFYSHDVLNMRTGKLAIVWLAATGRIKYGGKKCDTRDIMGTAVYKICDEIMRHINAQYLCSVSSLNEYPARFSLYLSSMLMYGTIKVYSYQVIHLLEDASIAYTKLLTGSVLSRELLGPTTPGITSFTKTTLTDVCNIDPLLFGTAFEGDFDLFRLHLEDETDFITPRKIGKDDPLQKLSTSKKKKIVSSSKTVILRDKGPIRESDVTFVSEMDLLLHDWDELAAPHHHLDATAITLVEDIPISHKDEPEQLTVQMEDDMGPPFIQFPRGFLEPSAKFQDESIRTDTSMEHPQLSEAIQSEQILTTEVQPEGEILGMLPPLAKTPADQLVTSGKSPIRKKKGKKRTLYAEEESTILQEESAAEPQKITEETPHLPSKRPETEPPSQIELQSISAERGPLHRKLKKRRLFVDKFTQISSDKLRNQINHYGDTMRELEFYKDTIHVKWWKCMVPVDQLFCKPRKEIQSADLSYLLARNFHTKSVDVEDDDFRPGTLMDVRRELNFHDSGIEGRRSPATLGEISTVESISSLMQHVSVTSAPGDISEAAAAQTSFLGQTTPILPAAEPLGPVSAFELKIPEVVITPSEDTETKKHRKTVDIDSIITETPAKRQKVTRIEEEKELSEAEIYPEPSATEDVHRARRPASPDLGFTNVTVVAEIHAHPDVLPPGQLEIAEEKYEGDSAKAIQERDFTFDSIQAEEELAPGPTRGDEQFIPQIFSPITAAIPHHIVGTPESRGQRLLSVLLDLDSLKKTRKSIQFTLNDLLPQNATRSNVATVFADLLDLHKKRKVNLSQKENYGDIFITKLSQ